eukprot:TRINITY_DN20102_c1_g1_i1.p1 TRINITY_DN20102_c1_g1~~TRINITY_DN20102_c1_g1_i1.p1  ORF type:complete len:438 (+),score=43.27 TRINITY_DN20102_c1_g1_i1:59-1372(+)
MIADPIAPCALQTPSWTLPASQLLNAAAEIVIMRFIQVFYVNTRRSIGNISVLKAVACVSFVAGTFCWSRVADHIQNLRFSLICAYVLACIAGCSQMVPYVNETDYMLVFVTVLWSFFLSQGISIVNTMSSTTLVERGITQDWHEQHVMTTVGWGIMSLITGQFLDVFGDWSIFIGFVTSSCLNVWICSVWLPSRQTRGHSAINQQQVTHAVVVSHEVVWFCVNLLICNMAMSLHETFCFVFLMNEFLNTSKFLLGASVAVMCLFQIGGFKYVQRVTSHSEVPMHSLLMVVFVCQSLLALRLYLNSILPEDQPWLIILVEPLHGIASGGMWASICEGIYRISPQGRVAQVAAIIKCVCTYLAFGIGSLLWGTVMLAGATYGYDYTMRDCFRWNAIFMGVWCVLWISGQTMCRRRRSYHASMRSLSARRMNTPSIGLA